MRPLRALAPLALALVVVPASRAAAQSVTPVALLRFVQGSPQGATVSHRDSCPKAAAARAYDALYAHRWDQAAELLEDALAADGRDPRHWQAYGTALYHAERYRESIAAFERAMLLGARGEGAWNVARAYARLDNTKQALRWLGSALERGERTRQAAREEPAFESLRADRRFRELTEASTALRRPHLDGQRSAVINAAFR